MSADIVYGHTPVAAYPHPTKGVQVLFRLPNGYGASIIGAGPFDPDVREIAVIMWTGRGPHHYTVLTHTPLGPDVIRATTDRIEGILNQIAEFTDEQVRAAQERYAPVFEEEE